MIDLEVRRLRLALRQRFVIARGSRDSVEVVRVVLRCAPGLEAEAECVPYARYGETPDSVLAALQTLNPLPSAALDEPTWPQSVLPAGAARNALDCALWALRAARARQPVHQLLDLPPPTAQITAYTLAIDTPECMAERAIQAKHRLLKLKLAGDGLDLARVQAVVSASPQAQLIVDANEGWSAEHWNRDAAALAELGVVMLEQPLPAGQDDDLRGARPLAVCADESCHTRADLNALRDRYDMINIKLDKSGGLTEACALLQQARHLQMGIMVGCMMASSLAMAPALLLAHAARYVDLDGPLWLLDDHSPIVLDYREDHVLPPQVGPWSAH